MCTGIGLVCHMLGSTCTQECKHALFKGNLQRLQ